MTCDTRLFVTWSCLSPDKVCEGLGLWSQQKSTVDNRQTDTMCLSSITLM